MIYGYCRISTARQNIERQERNIKAEYPSAVIVREAFTGTVIQRKGLDRILDNVKEGDTIVFDSVSRMSRNATEGFELYQRLFKSGVDLVFLKEPLINTQTYKEALKTGIPMTGTSVDLILSGVNAYLMELAKNQIRLAFQEAQKEVDDLHQRTKEGIATARLHGKQIGCKAGAKLLVKKAAPAKDVIRRHSMTFGGSLKDPECAKLAGVSKNTFYKYKRELLSEVQDKNYTQPVKAHQGKQT